MFLLVPLPLLLLTDYLRIVQLLVLIPASGGLYRMDSGERERRERREGGEREGGERERGRGREGEREGREGEMGRGEEGERGECVY